MRLIRKEDRQEVLEMHELYTRSWGNVHVTKITYPTQEDPHGKVTIRFKTGRTMTTTPFSIDCLFDGKREWETEPEPDHERTVWAVAVPLLIEAETEGEVRTVLREMFSAIQHDSVVAHNLDVGALATGLKKEHFL